uniref:Uncharacterized protein n=1 Tax=Sipha flava TaxID=143950 RepID=A0A2S2QH61_9HEMI
MMNAGTSVRVITAILLTQNLLAKCEDNHGIENGQLPFPMDHLHNFEHHTGQSDHSYSINEVDHSDFLDHLNAVGKNNPEFVSQLQTNMLQSNGLSKTISNNNNNKNIIRSVEVVHHDGDSLTKYETTHHDDDMFDETLIPSLSPSKKPISYTKVVKKMVIKRGGKNGEQSSALGSSQSGNEMLDSGNLQIIGIDNDMMSESRTVSQVDRAGNVRMPSMSIQQGSKLSDGLQNVVRTTVTKTTTTNERDASNDSGSGSANGVQGLVDSMPSNNIMLTLSPLKSDYNGITTDSLRSSSIDGDGIFETTSTAITDGNDRNGKRRQQIPRNKPFKRMKTTIIKHESIHDDENDDDNNDDHLGDLEKHDNESNAEFVRPANNIVVEIEPMVYSQLKKTTSINGDDFNIGTQIGSDSPRKRKNRENKPNSFANSLSQSGTTTQTNHESRSSASYPGLNLSKNHGASRQTQTNTVELQKANDETDYNELNGPMISFNADDKMGQLNGNMDLDNILTTTNQDNGNMVFADNMEHIDGFRPGGYILVTTQGVGGNGFRKVNGNNRMKKSKRGRSKKILVKNITYNGRNKNGKRNGGRKRRINGNRMRTRTGTNGNVMGMNKGNSGGKATRRRSGVNGKKSGIGGGDSKRSGELSSGCRSGGGMSGSRSSGGISGSRSSGGMSGSGSSGGISGSGSDERTSMARTARSSGRQNADGKLYSSRVYVIESPKTSSSFTKSYTNDANKHQHESKVCNCKRQQRSLSRRNLSDESTGEKENRVPAGSDDNQPSATDSAQPVFFNGRWKSIAGERMTDAQHRKADLSDLLLTADNMDQGARRLGGPPGPQINELSGSRPFFKLYGARHLQGSAASQHPPPSGDSVSRFGDFKNDFSKIAFARMMPPTAPHGFMGMQSDGINTVSSGVYQLRGDRGDSGHFGFEQIDETANTDYSMGSATAVNAPVNDATMSNMNGVTRYTKIIRTTKTVDEDNPVLETIDVARIQSE